MTETTEGLHASTVIWEPIQPQTTRMAEFLAWAGPRHGAKLSTYREALEWSVDDPSQFWNDVREFFDVLGTGFDGPALAEERMPGAVWYPNARLNYAQNILRHVDDPALAESIAILHIEEDDTTIDLTWAQLGARVASFAAALRARGIKSGDTVVAVLPNEPAAIIGLLASASIGAIWCICSPDLAAAAALSRLRQLEPTVLIGSLGYGFNGSWFDRTSHLAEIEAGLPTLRHTIEVGKPRAGRTNFNDLVLDDVPARFESLPFDHPLWVLFTSGTTGIPKGIVHGHGGMILESLKMFGLHFDMGPGDRYYVAANTSWMVWNTVLGNLLSGASVVTSSGSPLYPRLDRQLHIVALTGATMLATGAAYLQRLQGAGLRPSDDLDLSALKEIMSTGSTLPDATYQWVHDAVRAQTHLCDTSGGTDICSAFVGSNPLEPVRLGRIQGPMLGVAIDVRDEDGDAVIGQVGELVITKPMPSMPVCFWGDNDGSLYNAAYFEQYPGVWTHGDWVLEGDDGSFEVLGRSDATLNRAGVRLGSAEIYGALQAVDGVKESLVIGLELPDGGYYLPLFVVLDDGRELDDALRATISDSIRRNASAWHVPDEIIIAPAVPVTHAGKKIEIPVKRLFAGVDPSRIDRGSLSNPGALDWFVAEAQRFRSSRDLPARGR